MTTSWHSVDTKNIMAAPNKNAGANDGWPSQFRFAVDVGLSVMAQLGR
jgi:hypothetical protein